MKQISKILASFIVMLAFTATTFGQVSATATASATIVGPIAIANTRDMNFGNVAVSASLGTVVMDPTGARTVTGGCTLPAVTGGPTSASFNVTGAADYTYSITLPAVATTLSDGGTNTMTVDTWTSTPTVVAGGQLSGTGAQTLTVGATLHVAGGQAAGTYTSTAPFTVTVNYN